MAQIIIKSKHGGVEITVDEWMLPILAKYNLVYNVKTGYVQCHPKGVKKRTTITLQQLVANTPKGFVTHHKNHNKNDYRLDNLDIVTRLKHAHLQLKNKTYKNEPTSSKYKNVGWNNAHQKWHAYIIVDHQPLYLGSYSDEYVAACVSDWFEKFFFIDRTENLPMAEISDLELAGVNMAKLIGRVKKNLLKHKKDHFASKLDNLDDFAGALI